MEYNYYINNYIIGNRILPFIFKIRMTEQINKKILFTVLVFSSLVLIFAFTIEYQLGHKPCKLCIYQRIPYFLSILLIIKMLFIKKHQRVTLLILFLVFISSTTLAFYHFGIEQGFFSESLSCINEDLSKTLSKDELLQQLKQNSISCKEVSFRVLGLSLATINTIFSLVLSVIFIRLFLDYGNN